MSDTKTPAELREQTARSIAADKASVRRPPIGQLSPKDVVAHRRRLAKIRRIAEARATAAEVATTDKSDGLAGVVRQLAQKGAKR